MTEIEFNPIVRRFAERSPLPVMARAVRGSRTFSKFWCASARLFLARQGLSGVADQHTRQAANPLVFLGFSERGAPKY